MKTGSFVLLILTVFSVRCFAAEKQASLSDLIRSGHVTIFDQQQNPLVDDVTLGGLNELVESLGKNEDFFQPTDILGDRYADEGTYTCTGFFILSSEQEQSYFSCEHVSGSMCEREMPLPGEFLESSSFQSLLKKINRRLSDGAWFIEIKLIRDSRRTFCFLAPHQDNRNFLFTLLTGVAGLPEGQGEMRIWQNARGTRTIEKSFDAWFDRTERPEMLASLHPKAGTGYMIREIPVCHCKERDYPCVLHGHNGWSVPESTSGEEVRRNLIIVKARSIKKSSEGRWLLSPEKIYPLDHCADCADGSAD
ncbi:MAG: hypothetical protein H6618_05510 [Deltaproteobacteria bacterium]|nr:hypothetical protein [Deltaproteobacteria bacterium]